MMVSNYEYRTEGTPEQEYLIFSKAYLSAAIAIIEDLEKKPEKYNYAHAATAAFNLRLGTELFLKAAIIKKDKEFKKLNHSINSLARTYRKLYPDSFFHVDLPFENKFAGFIEENLETLVKQADQQHPTDQILRYPRHKDGSHWNTLMAFNLETLKEQSIMHSAKIDELSNIIFK
ncbi:hypothetical protein NT239_12495 [Chitinibacter sp. SCUT-21]|uniref:hypothetical protein n=1 Tax=Chitinibacter sp. SCUT-21 TaxID=2970891 RepID=UPI0035A6B9D6